MRLKPNAAQASSMAKSTADKFEEQYGNLVREQYAHCGTARVLGNALKTRRPPICITDGVLKQRFKKYGHKEDATAAEAETAIRISNRAELETKYGDILGPMADANPSAFRLCAALKKLTPPVLVTDGVAKEWFKHNRGKLKYVSKAGDLEVHCGARIRDIGRRGGWFRPQ